MAEAGVIVKFLSQASKVAFFCERERQDPKGGVNAEWGPSLRPGGEEDARPSLLGNKGGVKRFRPILARVVVGLHL